MIPEPTTAAVNSSEPRNSADDGASHLQPASSRRASADLVQPRLQLGAVERAHAAGCVKTLMRFSSSRNAVRNASHFSVSVPSTAAGSSTPQCAVIGWPGQYGQHLSRGVVADGEDEIERRRARRRELVPALAAQAIGGHLHVPEQLERDGMHLALRAAAGAVADELAATPMIDQRFAEDAARRIAGAENQYVEWLFGHCSDPVRVVWT